MSEEHLNYTSCFDIIGPIMIGPSSSHTAGACAIGRSVHDLFGEIPTKVLITYYESFAETHQGHGTDYALIAGILGMGAADERVPNSLDIAKDKGIEITIRESKLESPAHHANTAMVTVMSETGHELTVVGVSIGGGAMELRLIQENGMMIQPNFTTNLIVLKTKADFNNQVLNKRLENLNIDVINEQTSQDKKNQLILINTERSLSCNEFKTLTDGLDIIRKVRL